MLNIEIFKSLNGLAGLSPIGDKIIIFLASTLGFLIIILTAVFLFLHRDTREGENAWSGFRRKVREIILVFIVSALAWTISSLLKNLIENPRPYAILEGVTKLFAPNDPYSFPSGHATFFSALAMAVYFHHKRLALWFAVAAVFIGLARVASGIHFPSDVLTGWGLGILVAGIVAYLRKKV